MKWKRKLVDVRAERDLLTGMIVSDKFLKEIRSIVSIDLLQLPYSKTVGQWCLDYYSRYETAPRETIEDLFHQETKDNRMDEERAEHIAKFLESISSEYAEGQPFNAPYALDQAERYLKTRKLEELKEDITAALVNDDVTKAEASVATFKRVARPHSTSVDILKDKEAIVNAITEEEEVLFRLPGELGRVIQDFSRDDFVAVTAPAKRGKTWWLQELGLRALMAGCRVWFVSLEMTQSQMLRRIYQNLLGETRKPTDPAYPIAIPYFNADGLVEFKYQVKRGLSVNKAIRKKQALAKMIKRGQFRLDCYPAYSISTGDLRNQLDNLAHYHNFVPDVILADYADIFAPEKAGEYRHQVDHTWKSLRALAQERHCLVGTASHSGRATLGRDVEQGDVVEDIRKLNHVTCMFAVNQTKEDREVGASRIKLLAHRHESFDLDREVFVLQSLDIGKPYLDSRLRFGNEELQKMEED